MKLILYSVSVEGWSECLEKLVAHKESVTEEARETAENAALAVTHIPPQPFKLSAEQP